METPRKYGRGTPSYYWNHREEQLKKRREYHQRMKNNPTYREKRRLLNAERYQRLRLSARKVRNRATIESRRKKLWQLRVEWADNINLLENRKLSYLNYSKIAEEIGKKVLQQLSYEDIYCPHRGFTYDFLCRKNGKIFGVDVTRSVRKRLNHEHIGIAKYFNFDVIILFVKPDLTRYQLVDVPLIELLPVNKATMRYVNPSKSEPIIV